MKKKEINRDEQLQILAQITRRYIDSTKAFDKHYEETKEGYRYLANQPYSDEDKEFWDKLNRETRAYNLIFSQFNTLVGEFISNKTPATIKPDVGGTPEIASVFNDLKTHATNDNDLGDTLGRWMLSGFIKAGYLYPRYSDEKHFDGSVFVSDLNELEVSYDPQAKDPLLRDSQYWFRAGWYSKTKCLKMAKDKKTKKLIEEALTARLSASHYSIGGDMFSGIVDDPNIVNEIDGTYLVVEYHYFKEEVEEYLLDLYSGKKEKLKLTGNKRELYLKTNPQKKLLPQKTRKEKRIKSFIPGLFAELSDVPSNNQDDTHDLCRFSSMQNYVKKAIDTYGIFRQMKDSQDSFNEWSNIQEDIAIKNIRPRKAVKPSKILNYQLFTEEGDRAGFQIELDETAGSVKDVYEEMKPPNINIGENMRRSIAEILPRITGVTQNLSGESETRGENASLYAQRVMQSRVGLQTYAAAYRQSIKYFWNKVISIMQQNYTSERIFYIENRAPYASLNQMKRVMINIKYGEEIINDITRGRYKVYVDDGYNDTNSRKLRSLERMQESERLVNLFGPMAFLPEWVYADSDISDIQILIDHINKVLGGTQDEAEKQNAMGMAQNIQDLAMKQQSMIEPKEAGTPGRTLAETGANPNQTRTPGSNGGRGRN